MIFYNIDKHMARLLRTLDGTKYLVLDDFVLRHQNVSYLIKHLVISPYGVFVIDTMDAKNGVIGNAKEQSWVLSNGSFIDNPVLKANTLINYLDEHLHLRDEYYSFILGVNDKSIFNINGSFDMENVEDVPALMLQKYTVVIPNYNEIYDSLLTGSYLTEKINNVSGLEMSCPICGRALVERQNATGSYYSCLNYPRCNYTMSKPD